MRQMILFLRVLVGVVLLAGRGQAQTAITVSAAASMKDVLTTLGNDYNHAHPGTTLNFNFASSGTLQRQIEQGAPVDLFISAADKNMDELAAKNLIDKATRRVLAGNTLVLIVPRGSTLGVRSFHDLGKANVTHVAIGAPQSVPAGKYAQQLLTKIGIWDAVLRKAVQGKDVREVLTQVELGNVEAGIVYRTDAAISSKVKIVAVAPSGLHKPIRYPLAVVSASTHKAEATLFANYLTSAKAKAVLRRYQFVVK